MTLLLTVSAFYIVIFANIPLVGNITYMDQFVFGMFLILIACIIMHTAYYGLTRTHSDDIINFTGFVSRGISFFRYFSSYLIYYYFISYFRSYWVYHSTYGTINRFSSSHFDFLFHFFS